MPSPIDVTIVGAGPYGLSLAATLGNVPNLRCGIVGRPMHSWLTQMPKGMLLKSAGFATNLIPPVGQNLSLRHFYEERDLAFDPLATPIPLDLFASYGLEFRKRFVPNLLNEHVSTIAPCADGFRLTTENGTSFTSRKVILATGIGEFAQVPESLGALPKEFVTHSSAHHDLHKFCGRKVAIVGSGSSGVDLAVLLQEAGADVVHIMRSNRAVFGCIWREGRTSWWGRLRAPLSGIGPGWRNRLFADLPWSFRYLPDHLRLKIVRGHLGPSAGWFIHDRAEAVPKLYQHTIREAHVEGSSVLLRLAQDNGCNRTIKVDHVIAATGFKVDLGRLPYLRSDLRMRLRLLCNYPRLNGNFESSVPGLFFVGPVTAGAFGPLTRFVFGAGFTCQQVNRHFTGMRGKHRPSGR